MYYIILSCREKRSSGASQKHALSPQERAACGEYQPLSFSFGGGCEVLRVCVCIGCVSCLYVYPFLFDSLRGKVASTPTGRHAVALR